VVEQRVDGVLRAGSSGAIRAAQFAVDHRAGRVTSGRSQRADTSASMLIVRGDSPCTIPSRVAVRMRPYVR